MKVGEIDPWVAAWRYNDCNTGLRSPLDGGEGGKLFIDLLAPVCKVCCKFDPVLRFTGSFPKILSTEKFSRLLLDLPTAAAEDSTRE